MIANSAHYVRIRHLVISSLLVAASAVLVNADASHINGRVARHPADDSHSLWYVLEFETPPLRIAKQYHRGRGGTRYPASCQARHSDGVTAPQAWRHLFTSCRRSCNITPTAHRQPLLSSCLLRHTPIRTLDYFRLMYAWHHTLCCRFENTVSRPCNTYDNIHGAFR